MASLNMDTKFLLRFCGTSKVNERAGLKSVSAELVAMEHDTPKSSKIFADRSTVYQGAGMHNLLVCGIGVICGQVRAPVKESGLSKGPTTARTSSTGSRSG